MFVAWWWAHWPDSNFIYVSYSIKLATRQTSFIRQIVSSPAYRYLFDVSIDPTTRAKDNFRTTAGGSISAFGSSGSITGVSAGLPGLDRPSGAIIYDDPHKPSEALSDTIRKSIIDIYDSTIRNRCRGENVPIIGMAQRTHEDDIINFWLSGKDVDEWETIILPELDNAGNILLPDVRNRETVLALQKKSPYVFASQHQQTPIPAGGALFRPEWFVTLEEEPVMLCTFITADTAESTKSWADYTVFSFFGLYEIELFGNKTGQLGLHWLDCHEVRIEPKDLKDEFMDFFIHCSKHPQPPLISAIEKKSTGATLVSVLKDMRMMTIREIERTPESGPKGKRFLEAQPYISSGHISFTEGAKHMDNCISHMSRITPNASHRHDDIADTLADAIKIALIDKSLVFSRPEKNNERNDMMNKLNSAHNRRTGARRAAWQR